MQMEENIKSIVDSILKILNHNNDPKHIMTNIYKLLSKSLPIDTLSMASYDSDTGIIHYKAFVINKNAILLNETIKLSSNARQAFDNFIKIPNKILVFNNSNEIAYAKEVINFFRVKDIVSTVILFTCTEKKNYSGLIFAAYGQNRYTKQHINLINNLNKTLTKVIKHCLHLLKVTKNKNKILSENHEVRNLIEYQRIDLVLNSQSGLRVILEQIEQVAPLDSPVLITGETGVGKELAASLIHSSSKRVDSPFICVNCGAIPESLLDSELFGYEKGAFTGASQRRTGYFEQADKGSLFLDEVGELSLAAQVKLLRALQNKIIQRVGGTESIPIDVRVLAATNRDLIMMIKENKFRQDLWYRLNVFPIIIPPLRERKNDIPALVQYLINNKLFEMNLPFQPVLAPHAIKQLINYDWPGNVRELQNIIERALILCKGEPLEFPNLAVNQFNLKIKEEPETENDIFPTMEQMMIIHINKSLELSNGKIEGPGGAAELLAMNPSTLRARMRKLGIKKNFSWIKK